MIQSIDIPLSGGHLHCYRVGTGSMPLIAFHGFADDGMVFSPLFASLSSSFIIYAVDLPFHGKSDWKGPEYSPEDMMELIQWIRQKEGSPRIGMMGYSMGGRMVFSMLPKLAAMVELGIFLAPDGLGTRGLIIASSLPASMRRRLGSVAQRPTLLLRLSNFLYRKGFISRFINSFLFHHLGSPENHYRLIQSWVSMSNFPVEKGLVREIAERNQLPIIVVAGDKDWLVPVKIIKRAFRNTPQFRIIEESANHRLISESVGQKVAQTLAFFFR